MTKTETNTSRSTRLATARRAGLSGDQRRSARPSGPSLNGVLSFEFRHSNFRARRGFTLIELMISIALVLVLMLGINQIFKYTTQAVGAGEAINAATRGSRAIQAAFAQDFAAMVSPGSGPTDAPYLIISNGQIYAYRNQKDFAAQGAYPTGSLPFSVVNNSNVPLGSPYQDFAGTGNFGDPSVNGDVTYPYTYNNRNHRIDVLTFFARDQFHRQTGNTGTFVDDMTSPEAMIWYGHASIPENTSTYAPGPGQPLGSGYNNDNNFFASQFVLARMAMLLVAPSILPDGSVGIQDTAGNKQNYFQAGPTVLDPLSYTSKSTNIPPSLGQSPLYSSRYDLAGISMASFRAQLQYYLSNTASPGAWWQPLMDGEPLSGQASYRYTCNPYVTKPMTADTMAAAAPYFLGSCTQFTVEFAGDYITQDNNPNDAGYGNGLAIGPDGEVDYQLIKDPITNIFRKQIIWYGLPRNTSGVTPMNPFKNGDVMPVAWWLNQFGATSDVQSFEKALPGMYTAVAGRTYTQSPTNMQAGDRYICAWGPNDKATRPKLIRITLTLDDPNGQLPDGQTYQYVFAVP